MASRPRKRWRRAEGDIPQFRRCAQCGRRWKQSPGDLCRQCYREKAQVEGWLMPDALARAKLERTQAAIDALRVKTPRRERKFVTIDHHEFEIVWP